MDLNELAIFVAIVKHGSFSSASKTLRIPISTVSRKLADLERRLATNLITRTTRQLKLTDQGMQFYSRCSEHLLGLEAAESNLKQSTNEIDGHLKISVPVALGQGPFIGFVADFLKRYPKISIDLLVTNQFVDFISSGIDIAIRFGQLEDSSLIAKRLGESRWLLACSPKYLHKRTAPKHPDDLLKHSCIRFSSSLAQSEWNLIEGRKKVSIHVSGNVSGNNFETIYDLVKQGLGIGFLPEAYIHRGLNRNEFVQILPKWSSPPIPVHALYATRKYPLLRQKIFLDELSHWQSESWKSR